MIFLIAAHTKVDFGSTIALLAFALLFHLRADRRTLSFSVCSGCICSILFLLQTCLYYIEYLYTGTWFDLPF